jgi:hypothetical protein
VETDELRKIIDREPFHPFTIHMNDGTRLTVRQPDDIFLHSSWPDEAIVVLGKRNWSFVYLPNIAHVTTRGKWPRVNGRRRRGSSSEGE